MNKFLLLSSLCLSSAFVLNEPAFAAPTKVAGSTLPAEVASLLPKGATSFLCQQLPIGPQETKRLVHIWAATRPNTPDTSNSYDQFSNSPFCVDVFAPVLDQKKHWGWHLISSAAYIDANQPVVLKTHWLKPATKGGPILEIVSSNGAPGISTRHTLLVWDNGFREGFPSPTPQIFWSGGSGGGLLSQEFDAVDQSGTMTVTSVDSYADKVRSTTVYRWDGERFAHGASQEEQKAP